MVVEVLEEDCYDASSSGRGASYADLPPGAAHELADDLAPIWPRSGQ